MNESGARATPFPAAPSGASAAHPSFPQPADPQATVWRYVDLAKFVILLDEHRLHLTRLDRLPDPHEGAPPRAGLRTVVRGTRRATYVSSWYIGEHESEAMWRLYCPGGQGVALQTRYARLAATAAAHPEMHVGMVTYIDYEAERFHAPDPFAPIMHKRVAFAHEREVRMVVALPEAMDPAQPLGPPGIDIEWDPERELEAVYVDPYADAYFAQAVRAVLRRLAPGLLDRLVWSHMRVAPLV